MDAEKPRLSRHLPRFARVLRARPKLFLSVVLGLVIIAALPADWRVATRMLVGWDVGLGFYLAVVYSAVAGSDVSHIRLRASIEDEGRVAILILTVVAALASLGAIIAELGTSQGVPNREPLHLLLATLTIVLSWGFIHTIFALHYAHDYYTDHRKTGCLAFPGDGEPDYWDFVYFSFVIGMTSQVSDVAVTSHGTRQTVIAHGIVSFLFNVALLALTVNIAASAI
jgi:uncharacterized membrane protein